MFYDSLKHLFGLGDISIWPTSSGNDGCEQMHEGAVLEMKKKTILTNEKETRRAIKAAVDKAKEVDEMEKYRDADRWEEVIRI